MPYRSAHADLDNFAAVKKSTPSDEELRIAVVLLIDCLKAVNTLQHPF